MITDINRAIKGLGRFKADSDAKTIIVSRLGWVSFCDFSLMMIRVKGYGTYAPRPSTLDLCWRKGGHSKHVCLIPAWWEFWGSCGRPGGRRWAQSLMQVAGLLSFVWVWDQEQGGESEPGPFTSQGSEIVPGWWNPLDTIRSKWQSFLKKRLSNLILQDSLRLRSSSKLIKHMKPRKRWNIMTAETANNGITHPGTADTGIVGYGI